MWESITSDTFILNCVAGYKLEFVDQPVQKYIPHQIAFSDDESAIIDTEIDRLISIGAISRCEHVDGEFISHIFTRTKINGKIRLILNLKPLNEFLLYEHFKMEHLDFVCEITKRGDWFGSIDLSDAYFAVPIHESHWKFLRFYWRNNLYEYRVMVFGLSAGPRIFTRLCKPVLALLRGAYNIRCSLYIDDMIIMNDARNGLLRDISVAQELLGSLGFTVNLQKSVLHPVQSIKHLGVIIDSNKLTLSLPTEKMDMLENKCRNALKNSKQISIRSVSSLVGSLVACCVGTKWGKLHYRVLEKEKQRALNFRKGDFDAMMPITAGLKDIEWWLTNGKLIPNQFGPKLSHVTVYSDASKQGWGGHCDHLQTGGRWSSVESSNHINWLELKAAWLTIQSFATHNSDLHILLRIDNTCAIAYINKMGGPSAKLNELATNMWEWCQLRNIWISAKHIPGVANTIADFKSRVFNDTSEWSLNDRSFDLIVDTWGTPNIDLFASRLNYKVSKFISWSPDPLCFDVDALTTFWGNLGLCYAFPPFSIIGKVLAKAITDQAELLLIVPEWKTQHWFPMIKQLKLIVAEGKPNPLRLHMCNSTLCLPFNSTAVHPIWNRLNLLCYRLSGKR